MTLVEFTPIYSSLALQLQAADADEASLRVYHQALQKLDVELVAMAAERIAINASFFPKTSEWYAMATQIEAERQAKLQHILLHRIEPLCAWCNDTGWKPREDERVERCHCFTVRRDEVLGRRPMPLLEGA